MTVVVRFAPAPTGYLHIGNVRTAIITWLFTKDQRGYFILRIDDTDSERSSQKYETAIKEDFNWLGMTWDYSFNQSSRSDRYKYVLKDLINRGLVYKCYETKEELIQKREKALAEKRPPIYDREGLTLTQKQISQFETEGRVPHFRFKLNDSEVSWNDGINGNIKMPAGSIGDPVIAKANGSPLYNFVTAIDDFDYGITHIIRGGDHVTNTAIQVSILRALGVKEINEQEDWIIKDNSNFYEEEKTKGKEHESILTFNELKSSYKNLEEPYESFLTKRKEKHMPTFLHLPLLYAPDGEISKRIGGFDIRSLKNEGVHPMAINSYLTKVGTSDMVELAFSLQELIEDFSIDKYNSSNVCYEKELLLKLNAKLLHNIPNSAFVKIFYSYLDNVLAKGCEDKDHNNDEKIKNDNVKDTKCDIIKKYENLYYDKEKFLSQVDQKFWNMVQSELSTLSDVYEWLEIVYGDIKRYMVQRKFADSVLNALNKYNQLDEEKVKEIIKHIKGETHWEKGKIFKKIRKVLTGKNDGPEVGKIMLIISLDKIKKRFEDSACDEEMIVNDL